MDEMLTFDAPKQRASIIKVLGVGGGGSNAVTHMYRQGIKGVDFIICNTDAQSMELSAVPNKIQLGDKGLGAGAVPEVGKAAAEKTLDDIREFLENHTKMLFITAGMGGGTGTGAAPVIAKLAREMDILTVGIVTIPFAFEGRKRRLQAEKGIEELKQHVDTLLIISNEKLREIHGNLKLSEAFGKADDILAIAAKGIAEIITVTGYINVDFEDVKTVMKDSGTAIMGSATAEGEDRAGMAVREALSSPLLNDNKIQGASNILLYISSGKEEITFDEVTEITDYIQEEAGQSAEVIWGNGYEEELGDKISITLIATGFQAPDDIDRSTLNHGRKKKIFTLDDTHPGDQNKTTENETPVTAGVEEPEEEPVTEIKLIKKEKPIEAEKSSSTGTLPITPKSVPAEQPKQHTLFGQQHRPLQKQVEDPANIANSANGSLRIKHTVGAFPADMEHAADMPSHEMMQKRVEERVQKLKGFSFFSGKKAAQPEEDTDKVPAYVRKNIQLKPVMSSSEPNVARYVLSADNDNDDGALRENDIPFIHNKPD
ncbi:MAG TPA: cell division protein FtsZ [Bacteroidales bacterium]|nr:cell division protein FtsZ [Bacteroidales bacterium]